MEKLKIAKRGIDTTKNLIITNEFKTNNIILF